MKDMASYESAWWRQFETLEPAHNRGMISYYQSRIPDIFFMDDNSGTSANRPVNNVASTAIIYQARHVHRNRLRNGLHHYHNLCDLLPAHLVSVMVTKMCIWPTSESRGKYYHCP